MPRSESRQKIALKAVSKATLSPCVSTLSVRMSHRCQSLRVRPSREPRALRLPPPPPASRSRPRARVPRAPSPPEWAPRTWGAFSPGLRTPTQHMEQGPRRARRAQTRGDAGARRAAGHSSTDGALGPREWRGPRSRHIAWSRGGAPPHPSPPAAAERPWEQRM